MVHCGRGPKLQIPGKRTFGDKAHVVHQHTFVFVGAKYPKTFGHWLMHPSTDVVFGASATTLCFLVHTPTPSCRKSTGEGPPHLSSRHTKVNHLSLGMLGPREAPCLHAKGAETHGLLGFGQQLLRRYLEPLGAKGHQLLGAAEAAQSFDDVLYAAARDEVPDQRGLLAAMQRFAHLFGLCSTLRPKVHLMMHLILQADYLGNPLNHHTYQDESLNGKLARIARSTHRRRFMIATMTKYKLMTEISKLVPHLGAHWRWRSPAPFGKGRSAPDPPAARPLPSSRTLTRCAFSPSLVGLLGCAVPLSSSIDLG